MQNVFGGKVHRQLRTKGNAGARTDLSAAVRVSDPPEGKVASARYGCIPEHGMIREDKIQGNVFYLRPFNVEKDNAVSLGFRTGTFTTGISSRRR